jgi:four helix bundle protein
MKPQNLNDRTKAFSLQIIELYSKLPRHTVAQVLGKQVLRSGTSVGANYREASRGRSKAEFIAKVGDSLREAAETEYWLELLTDSRCITIGVASPLRDESRQLVAILTTINIKAKKKAGDFC